MDFLLAFARALAFELAFARAAVASLAALLPAFALDLDLDDFEADLSATLFALPPLLRRRVVLERDLPDLALPLNAFLNFLPTTLPLALLRDLALPCNLAFDLRLSLVVLLLTAWALPGTGLSSTLIGVRGFMLD